MGLFGSGEFHDRPSHAILVIAFRQVEAQIAKY